MFLITEILIIYYHYTKNVRILVQLQTSTLPNARYAQIRTWGRIISVEGKLSTMGIGIWQV